MFGQLLGGIGLFLVGMVLTTQGLRAVAGETLRKTLLRFTGGPVQALISGTLVTALVQSSSVTTVATIGFVGAGLLTFEQSLGVIFGANIGTTVTGWLVATVGLKLDVASLALPAVGVGAGLNIFGRGRGSEAGLALAGLGLIFVGVGTLQEGMQGLSAYVTPAELPGDGLGGRLLLLATGMLMTVVMQSSSAAVATTLTALHSGSIALSQSAALVIGVNIGTTVTAALAAIGASTSAKRSALAHTLFNLVTGVVALALLPVFVALVRHLSLQLGRDDAAISLAAFHTAFNLFGVALMLPFTRQLSRLVVRLVPQSGDRLTRHLDVNATQLGSLAIEAVRQTALEMANEVFVTLADALRRGEFTRISKQRLQSVEAAGRETTRFISELTGTEHPARELRRRHASTLHALDHLERLTSTLLRLDESVFLPREEVAVLRAALLELLDTVLAWASDPTRTAPVNTVEATSQRLAAQRKELREAVLRRTAKGELDAADAGRLIEAARRVDEMGYYIWRITDHLSGERNLAAELD